ncbi:MAG: PDZ domain-containing protein [Planctomycetia bacterium]|nr:PDZ domain-containing protein [Planctomycetia bacterium]
MKPEQFKCIFRCVAAIVAAALAASAARAQQSLPQLEEQAMRAAVARVAPSVVKIETVGGLERVGKVLVGTGPTTGLVVSSDGYIVSSAFNFAQKPSSILVGLADGTRTPARLVATDHQRMLVLLKVTVDELLPVPEAVPENEIQVGQWSIAVGRTFEGREPNMSAGIVSGLNRIWGKAIQTDAKISPANYGGPLVDIRGRVLGVLVPLSPTSGDDIAGVEWYDSGIGFAVPLAHVNSVLPKLVQGTDLKPGIMGVSLNGRDMYTKPPVIVACRPNSPAYKAGLKAGDRIVEIDGAAIERQAQLRQQINRRYAGDTIHVAVLRGDERIERDIPLVDQLDPYARPFLGILPRRDAPADTAGIPVRYVYPESPAAKAGMKPGDTIAGFDGEAVANRDALVERASGLEIGQPAKVELRRAGETLTVELAPVAEPTAVPAELPPAREGNPAAPEGERPQVGQFAVKIPEFKNECTAYVPEAYNPRVPHGLVVWLHPPGGTKDEDLLARWKEPCDRLNLILLAPRSGDPARWVPPEVDFVAKTIDQIREHYNVDPQRVVVHGQQAGGSLAYVVAFAHRDAVRGVAAVDAPILGRPPENEPAYRLSFFVTSAKKANFAEPIKAGIEQLREMKYPVTVTDQGDTARYLDDREFAELLRWIDSLDRI